MSSSISLKHYVAIARFDHWFKNFLMLPGFALALVLGNVRDYSVVISLILGLLSAGLIASANYTINGWLDGEFDRHHPVKHTRPSASGLVSAKLVYLQWFGLGLAGLVLAWTLSAQFFGAAAADSAYKGPYVSDAIGRAELKLGERRQNEAAMLAS